MDTSSIGETFGLAFQGCDQPAMGRTIPETNNITVMETPYQVLLKRFQVSIHRSACARQTCSHTNVMHCFEYQYALCIPCIYLQEKEGECLYEYCNTVDDDLDVDVFIVKEVLLQVLASIEVHRILTGNTTTASLDVRRMPLLQASADNLFMCLSEDEPQSSTSKEEEHALSLDNTLSSWNFQRIGMPRDGDCLFRAVAKNLEWLVDSNMHVQSLYRTITNAESHTREEDTAIHHLRRAVVREWLGPHSAEYCAFLTSSQLQQEAEQFLSPGMYTGELGDLVLLALANALCMPIVVFTSVANFSIAPILPTYSVPATSDAIYLAFTQYGTGHYDAAEPVSPTPSQLEQTTVSTQKCTCGRKKGTAGKACSTSNRLYSTRCPCATSGKACTNLCRCKYCENPNGKRSTETATPAHKRRRLQHTNQTIPLKGSTDVTFMEKAGEKVNIGKFTTFEFLLVTALSRKLEGDDSSDKTLYKYIRVVQALAVTMNITLPVNQRTEEDWTKLIKATQRAQSKADKYLA